MTSQDIVYLLPLIVLVVVQVVVMLSITIRRSHITVFVLTLAGLVAAFVSLLAVAPIESLQVTPLLIIDRYAVYFIALIIATSIAVTLLSFGYFRKQGGEPEEYYLLILLAAFGSSVLVASSHFASFFLGLEILSVSLYALIAYQRQLRHSVEAGLKYLVLAGTSSAFLLFGMALIYSQLGSMSIAVMASHLQMSGRGGADLVTVGLAMIVVGVGFKLAVVPFHLWTPDIYEGAPAPVTAFVATVSKGAVLALLVRYTLALNLLGYSSIFLIFWLIALASMVAGNFLALLQTNVKRILAYSSIAHLGYLLTAFLASGPVGVSSISFYLVAYFLATLLAFGTVTVLSRPDRDADQMQDYRGLFWRRPWLATMFTASLLSLAGIPLTAGFIGKVYLVAAGAGAALWALVIVLVLSSAVGLYYYLRIIVAMYTEVPEAEAQARVAAVSLLGSATLSVLTLLLIWLGVYPSPLFEVIRSTTLTLLR